MLSVFSVAQILCEPAPSMESFLGPGVCRDERGCGGGCSFPGATGGSSRVISEPMILYSEPTSPYSAVVRVAVYAKQLAIEIVAPPGGLKSDEYRALSGTGTVPCLKLDDGSALPESTVILAYLDDKFPERPLLPAGAEARAIGTVTTPKGVAPCSFWTMASTWRQRQCFTRPSCT